MKKIIIVCLSLGLLSGCRVRSGNVNSEIAPPPSKTESVSKHSDWSESTSESLSALDTNAIITDEPPRSDPEQQEKRIAFTFDDGPGDYTSPLLDSLAERGAKATFFIATNRVTTKNADLIRRMDAEGHEVANHTVSHSKLHLLTTEQIRKEVADADEVLRAITGKTPGLLRPPYGNFTTRVLGAIEKPAIVWSIDTRDCFDNKDPQGIRNFILERVSDGDIILLHEWGEYSKDGALSAMDALAEQGYRFVTVSELFAAKGIALESGRYYAAANGKDFAERIIFDRDDKYPDE